MQLYSNFNMFKIHSNWTNFEHFRQIDRILASLSPRILNTYCEMSRISRDFSSQTEGGT